MLHSLDAFRTALWIIFGLGLAALAAVFAGLILFRVIRTWLSRRRAVLEARYQPAIDQLVSPADWKAAVGRLAAAPPRHRDLIGTLMLRPLRVARGELVDRIREAASSLARDRIWLHELKDRRWWVRARAARALGLIRSAPALHALTSALDDHHEEVRAAAVESMGLLGDPEGIPALLARLPAQSRHQRVRVVEALRGFGPAATPALLAHGREAPADRLTVATVLGQIGGAEALPSLIDWMTDPDPLVRAAAVSSAGALGLDDRAYYFVLRALQDESPGVRVMAARAIARSPRPATSRYLEPLLDDTWDVAVQAALALKRLGAEGREVLERRRQAGGQAADLANQMLWEGDALGGRKLGD